MNAPEGIRLLVVDDSEIVLESLEHLFLAHPRIRIVATANSGKKAVSLFGHVRADVALIDLMMPGLDGFATARAALKADPKLRVIIFAAIHSIAYVEHSRQIGAAGFVTK